MPYKAYFFGIVGPPDDVCSRLKGLSRKQMDYCIDHREHIASVLSGANIAREECQFQLKNQRWNCSLSAKDNANVFGRVTKKGKLSVETIFRRERNLQNIEFVVIWRTLVLVAKTAQS